MGLRGLSACSKIKDGGERAQSSHSPTLDRLLASSLLALCFSWPRGPGGQAMMVRREGEEDGAGSDGTPAIATLGQLGQKDLSTSYPVSSRSACPT